jgi:hypothetical protein
MSSSDTRALGKEQVGSCFGVEGEAVYMTSCSPWVAKASVRALTTKAGSRRASQAAWIFSTISSAR